MERPLLSILCLCYNHDAFLDQALTSIENLSYQNLEVLVVDDCSRDNSVHLLKKWEQKKPGWKFWFHTKNEGNCRSFNQLLKEAKGKFVLDFATDDRLLPDGLEDWVGRLLSSPQAAFCYADAWLFGEGWQEKKLFSAQNPRPNWPEGHVLNHLFGKPFICPPAIMFRRSALLEIGGYNENLAYEDWNVWLQLARKHEVVRHPQPVLEYRSHPDSLSASLFRSRNVKLIDSTLEILDEVLHWPELKEGKKEVAHFVSYHLKICALLEFYPQGKAFWLILKRLTKPGRSDEFWCALIRLKIPVYWLVKQMKN